jgi:LysR family transcriptional regulator, regulator for bpeEF and oprC
VPVLGAFQAQYPNVRLSVTFTDRYIDLVEEGVDVSVRFGLLQDSSLIARRLTQSEFKVVGTPAYFARYGRPKTPDDLVKHNCLAFTFRDTRLSRPWRFATAAGESAIVPRGNMSFSDGAALFEAACAGYGLAQIHDFYPDTLITRGKLLPVLEKFRPKPEPIWLVYPPTRHLTPKVRAFVEFTTAQFRPSHVATAAR